jgi:hypothetical protein
MKIIVDESVSLGVASYLRNIGFACGRKEPG